MGLGNLVDNFASTIELAVGQSSDISPTHRADVNYYIRQYDFIEYATKLAHIMISYLERNRLIGM